MVKEKLKAIIKNKLFIVGFGAFVIGFMIARPSGSYVKNVTVVDYETLQTEVRSAIKDRDDYSEKNKNLQAKVDEAKPFFDMNKEEQTAMANEAKAKQDERLKKEKEESEAKKKADLESKTKTLSNGNFEAGKDFQAGIYNIVAVSGNGNVSSSNMYSGGLNAIMGVGNEYSGDLYQKEYNNIKLPQGVTLKVSNVTIKLVPVE